MKSIRKKSLSTAHRFQGWVLIGIIALLAGVGVYLVFHSHAASLTGDINTDGAVNGADLSILASNYNKAGTFTLAQGDINGDTHVTIIDLTLLAINWGSVGTTSSCTGVALTNGQSDINSHGPNTTFCLSGVHNNWSLVPQSGDQFIGDGTAVLDGTNTTQFAFQGSASNVVLDHLEIRNYIPNVQQAAIAATGSGWTLRSLQVHDNGTICPTAAAGTTCGSGTGPGGTYGGDGSSLGNGWHITGGRYYNNRDNGLAGNGTNTVVDGAEVDHNNFIDDTYTKPNITCDFEAGGIKSVANGLTVTNSNIHDNACRGLWTYINADGTTFTNNTVTNNWEEGIMIEISGAATISGNTVSGNGFKTAFSHFNGCSDRLGSGIFISTAGKTATSNGPILIYGNTVSGNCSAITGADDNRGGSYELANINIHDNNLIASTNVLAHNYFGMFVTDGDDLATHNIIFGPNNTLSGSINYCKLSC